jgi:hypothetical protein
MSRTGTVVGWDGSEPAGEALEWAADREERRGGELRIVRVLNREGPGDPAERVAAARVSLEHVVHGLELRHADLDIAVELVLGDPVVELDRAAGRDHLLVLGASTVGRARRPDARRIPVLLAARPAGTTAVVPAAAPGSRSGVLAVVCGRERSRAAIDFAVDAALERGEPLTIVRLHDPHDLEVDVPIRVEEEVLRLRTQLPDLDVRLARSWVSSPYGLLSRSDAASLLVLEGCRPSAAPPRYSFERWLAGQARAPFVVVAEALTAAAQQADAAGTKLALAV